MLLNNKYSRSNALMALSLILLVGFLSYWLYAEYLSFEEHRKVKEQRGFLLEFINELPERPVGLMGDDSFPNSVDSFMLTINMSDSLYTTNNQKSFFKTALTNSKTEFLRFDSVSVTSEFDTDRYQNLHGFLGSNKKNQLGLLEIMNGIKLQILFSLILLSIVGFAFRSIWINLKREKALSNLRNDFISNITHELKTPISTVNVALEAIQSFDVSQDPQKTKEYLAISRSELNRLGMLVDKTLNISLFEQGKYRYEKTAFNLRDLIEEILKTLSIQFDKNNTQTNLTITGDDFDIVADKTHLTNVIHNLIENAMKYGERPCKIDIHLSNEGEALKLKITDNGPGIPEEYRHKIFDKFFRVPSGDKHNVKGHGLGLSYVKQVIQSHGGSIALAESSSKGSSFVIQLNQQA